MSVAPAWSGLEQTFLYFPDSRQAATPGDYDLAYEEIRFAAADGTRLHGWLLPGPPDAPLVIFLMGNAGNKSYRVDNLRFLIELGVGVCIFDYRGYGRSAGTPSEAGLYSDVRGLLEYLAGRGWDPGRMIYFGRSLGAAVALQSALEQPPAGLVLETPFTSIAAMGRRHYPLLYPLLGWLVQADFDNLAKIERVESPLLVIYGETDRICPPEMVKTLYRQAPGPKQLVGIANAGHNETFTRGQKAYRDAWVKFLQNIPF
ncbi:MAG TPA: alpha/beta hydrolase [Desulfuromonadales bacterium]|nr:alpha/beta hydrolase [Desulfuromonadales bacterium]